VSTNAASRHVLVEVGVQTLAEIHAQLATELVGLGGDQRDGILIISPVRGVRVDQQIWIPEREELGECASAQAVGLDEVSVQIEMARIATKAEPLGTALVDSARPLAIGRPIYVVEGDVDEDQIAECPKLLSVNAEIAHQRHAGINALWLPGMDAVVVENHGATRCSNAVRVEVTIGTHDARMDGKSAI
jgi:hypothetical protein